jgi:hypothetical protein
LDRHVEERRKMIPINEIFQEILWIKGSLLEE